MGIFVIATKVSKYTLWKLYTHTIRIPKKTYQSSENNRIIAIELNLEKRGANLSDLPTYLQCDQVPTTTTTTQTVCMFVTLTNQWENVIAQQ